MAEFSTVMKAHERMCKIYSEQGCKECPISSYKSGANTTCYFLMKDHSERFEEIVTKWDAEHPRKTLKDHFFEMFPDAPKNGDGAPKLCPNYLGWDEFECCDYNCEKCWNRPWEEGDTLGR